MFRNGGGERAWLWSVGAFRPSACSTNERVGKTSQSSPADAGAMVCSIYKYPPRSPHVASVPVLKRSHLWILGCDTRIVVQAFFFAEEEEARDKHSFIQFFWAESKRKACGPRRDTAIVTGGLALEHSRKLAVGFRLSAEIASWFPGLSWPSWRRLDSKSMGHFAVGPAGIT